MYYQRQLLLHYILFSVTLYLAHSRVGRGNLELNLSLPHFPPNWRRVPPWRGVYISGIQRRAFASTAERRNENIQYYISTNGDRTHNLLRLLCAPALRLDSMDTYSLLSLAQET